MLHRVFLAFLMLLAFTMQACLQSNTSPASHQADNQAAWFVNELGDTISYVSKSDAEWKAVLDAQSYHVLRGKGTERAFTGEYNDNKRSGIYYCKGCGLSLFSSDTKFDSGTGWPSFHAPIDDTHVAEEEDRAFGMRRVEIICRRCGGHLGHVFDDGPKPTGLRYCMNSVSLDFKSE